MGPLKASLRVETHCEYWILFPYLFLFLFIWNFQQDRSFSIRKLARLGCTGIERTTETNERKCCANKITLRASDDPKKHRYWYRLKIEMQDGGWLTTVREFQFSLKWRSKFQPVRVKGSEIKPPLTADHRLKSRAGHSFSRSWFLLVPQIDSSNLFCKIVQFVIH
jgi:hypothetical protein